MIFYILSICRRIVNKKKKLPVYPRKYSVQRRLPNSMHCA